MVGVEVGLGPGPSASFHFSGDGSTDVESPGGFLGVKAERFEGDGQFGFPSLRIDGCTCLPDPIPIRVQENVIADNLVVTGPVGVDDKNISIALVVEGIQGHVEVVVAVDGSVVALHDPCIDGPWIRIIAPYANVEVILVVKNTEKGFFGHGFAGCRIVLPQRSCCRCLQPDRLVQLPINGGSCLDLNGTDGGLSCGFSQRRGGIDGSCQQALLAHEPSEPDAEHWNPLE